jgi:hypothetical protein
MELDPSYAHFMDARFEQFTGKTPLLEPDSGGATPPKMV